MKSDASRHPERVRAQEETSRAGRVLPLLRRQGDIVHWQRLAIPATAVRAGTWVPSRRHRHCLTRVAEVARTADATRASIRCGDGTEIVTDLVAHVVVARLLPERTTR